MSIPQQLPKSLLACPNTGRQASGDPVTTVHPISGGWAIWWRCPACHRWHMVEVMKNSRVTG